MATAQKIAIETSVRRYADFQLAKSLVLQANAMTALTAAQLSQHLFSINYAGADTLQVINVACISALRFEVWGVASNNHSCVFNLYGWPEVGHGHHIGTLTCTFGNFESAASTGFHTVGHSSITRAFVPTQAYRGCDTYAETQDYEDAITVFSAEADFPAFAEVSFANSQYAWFAAMPTTITSATSVAAIFKALGVKSNLGILDGV